MIGQGRWNVAPALVAWLALLPAGGCTEGAKTGQAGGYHPATVATVAGSDLHTVTLTDDAAARIGLRTAATARRGAGTAVPYAALIYDGQGKPWVYVRTLPRSFLRHAVTVDRVQGDVVLVTSALPEGAQVATTGSTQLYGAELGIDGSH